MISIISINNARALCPLYVQCVHEGIGVIVLCVPVVVERISKRTPPFDNFEIKEL